jgi:hypothetical protein
MASATTAAAVLLALTYFPASVAKLFWRGDLKYLNDFSYLPASNWATKVGEPLRIVAYSSEENRAVMGGGCLIGYNGGHIRYIPRVDLDWLLPAQGDPAP